MARLLLLLCAVLLAAASVAGLALAARRARAGDLPRAAPWALLWAGAGAGARVCLNGAKGRD
jgi:hypothetical protein